MISRYSSPAILLLLVWFCLPAFAQFGGFFQQGFPFGGHFQNQHAQDPSGSQRQHKGWAEFEGGMWNGAEETPLKEQSIVERDMSAQRP